MLEKQLDAIQKRLEAVDRLERISDRQARFLDALAKDGAVMRPNWSRVITHDTNSVAESEQVDVLKEVGVAASRLTVHGVGGGSLQVNVNGTGWVPVAAGDKFDESIRSLRVRATTAAAGIAVLRLVAYVGPQ